MADLLTHTSNLLFTFSDICPMVVEFRSAYSSGGCTRFTLVSLLIFHRKNHIPDSVLLDQYTPLSGLCQVLFQILKGVLPRTKKMYKQHPANSIPDKAKTEWTPNHSTRTPPTRTAIKPTAPPIAALTPSEMVLIL